MAEAVRRMSGCGSRVREEEGLGVTGRLEGVISLVIYAQMLPSRGRGRTMLQWLGQARQEVSRPSQQPNSEHSEQRIFVPVRASLPTLWACQDSIYLNLGPPMTCFNHGVPRRSSSASLLITGDATLSASIVRCDLLVEGRPLSPFNTPTACLEPGEKSDELERECD